MKNEEIKKKSKSSNSKGKTGKVETAKKSSTTRSKASTKTEKVTTTVKSNEKINENAKTTKNVNENLRMIIVGAVLIVLIAITFIIGLTRNVNKARYQKHVGINEISVSEYMQIIEEEDISIIYIARPTCGYCQMFEPILTSVLEKYKIGVEYVDISAISTQEEWDKFYNSNDFLASGEWGTPTLIVYKNKEILDINSGYVEEATLVQFLKDNELIGE